jgi:hypothetical protein
VTPRRSANFVRKLYFAVAGMGRFSSNRSICEYAERIWHVRPVDVILPNNSLGRMEVPPLVAAI